MDEDIDKLILDLIDPNLDIPGSMRPLRHAASLALRSQQSRIKELEQSNDEEAAAMLAAAPTAPAAVGGWQLIETAPKTGSFLACVAGCSEPVVARWVETPRGTKLVAADAEDFEDMDAWADYVADHDFPATHWMPLPAPPLQRERGAAAGQDGMIHPCALKGTGPAATLSESERVPIGDVISDAVTNGAERLDTAPVPGSDGFESQRTQPAASTASDDVVEEIARALYQQAWPIGEFYEVRDEYIGLARAVLSSPPVVEMREALDRIIDSVSVGPSGEVCQCSDFDDARSILSRFQPIASGDEGRG